MNSFNLKNKYNLQIGDRLVRNKGGIFSKHHGVYAGEDDYGTPIVAENQRGHGVRLISLSEFLLNDASTVSYTHLTLPTIYSV